MSNGEPINYITTTTAGDWTTGTCTIPINTNYYWPTYYWPQYAEASRVAALEGEVKVLREMLAALLTGKKVAK